MKEQIQKKIKENLDEALMTQVKRNMAKVLGLEHVAFNTWKDKSGNVFIWDNYKNRFDKHDKEQSDTTNELVRQAEEEWQKATPRGYMPGQEYPIKISINNTNRTFYASRTRGSNLKLKTLVFKRELEGWEKDWYWEHFEVNPKGEFKGRGRLMKATKQEIEEFNKHV